jgi:C1A family cysteine protease
MQLSKGIVGPVLLSVICLSLLFTAVCASDMNTPLDGQSDNQPRLAPLNPDYIAYTENITVTTVNINQKLMKVSENEQHVFGFIPPTIDLSYTKGQDVARNIRSNPAPYNGILTAGPYPPVFDLRTMSKVTPVKDQGSAGSCWAQATYASLESYLLPGEFWDFSENNMKNLLSVAYPEGFDRNAADGGNAIMSTAYLARWTGPVNETDDPYDPLSGVSPTDKPVRKHVQNVLFLPDRVNATDNINIKSALMTYGIVYTSMYIDGWYFNDTNAAYYYPGVNPPNHAVGIVGWNDNFSRNNFTPSPPGDGAFIIKNSWGTTFGEQGFFYISYFDSKIGMNNAVFTAESIQNYDGIYQYDPLGWVNNFGGLGHTLWGANVFTSNASETLSAVSFYATDVNTEYDLYVYKNPDNGPVNSTGYSHRQAGIMEGPPGYYTKVLTPGVALLPGENFSVVINLTTRNTVFPLPVEHAIPGYSSQATAHPGESYYSDDGGLTWSDMASFYPTENICIKAFTILPPPQAAFSADKISGKSPLTVVFNDSSTGSPTTWNWSFGDGSFNATQNPSHTFTQGGAYTISLNVTNAAGTDTLIKTSYIVVNGDKIGVFRNASGTWYMDFNTTGVVDKIFQFGKAGDVPVVGDWNGDGTTDAGVFRPSNGDWYLNYYKDSISHKAFHFGTIGDIPVNGDWDGDGTTDAGVFRPSVGNWYLDTTKTGVVNTSFQFGKSGDIPVTGDWDGDGTTDAGVFRSATGTWYLDTTKTGVVNTSFQFGKSGDIPVTGDWDGDGTTDAGVFRPSAGNWYLDTTKTGAVNTSFQFGKYGDIPVTGDWDGDGTTDAGVFRSATGTWYLNFHKNGISDKVFRFGIIGDNPKAGKWI